MIAEIMAVGTELLMGNIVNTNAQFIARRLTDMGIFVYYQTVVGDNAGRLKNALNLAFERADIVITTGGLGPTQDDLTKETGAEYFHKKLILDEKSLESIKCYFAKQGKTTNEGNKKQAYFPEGSMIIPNNHGTAPGCIIEENGKVMIMLPGPPSEVLPMFEEAIVPYLEKFQECTLVSKVLRVCGIGEGHMAEKINDLIMNENPTVAPYAKEGEVTLRITARAKNKDEGIKMVKTMEDKIREKLGDDVYGEGDTNSLEEVIGRMLIDNNITISTAESCTGGLLSGKLVNYPGISSVFLEGDVTYSNEAKMRNLNVKRETLDRYGAVSCETAVEMAEGIAKKTGTVIGISTTGIAGPAGGTAEKPVGLVYVGLYIDGKTKYKELHLTGDRQKIRSRAVMQSLDFLRRELNRYLKK